MLAGKAAAEPDAVWDSRTDPAAENHNKRKAGSAKTKSRTSKRSSAALPDFIAPQLCELVERPPSGDGWGHEIKFDGYRVQLRVQNEQVTLKTRKGLDWTGKFGAIAREAKSLPDAIIDGEIVALDENGAPDFAALQAALSEQDTDALIFYAFDLLFDDEADLRPQPLSDRKARLQTLLADHGSIDAARIRFVEHLETGGDAVLKSACRLALEGIVSKRIDAPYRSGRTNSWTKAKCRAGHEVVVGGWTTTHGRFRSLLVGVHRGAHFVYVGRVGTGYSETKVRQLLPRLKAITAAKSPFTGMGAPRNEANVNWTKPELVAEIEFAGWTGAGLVRQAAFNPSSTNQLLASDIYKANVYDPSEHKIGDVSDLMIDSNGNVTAAIISVGGQVAEGDCRPALHVRSDRSPQRPLWLPFAGYHSSDVVRTRFA
jgi:bifunctional non-homologous end joining protein LigD